MVGKRRKVHPSTKGRAALAGCRKGGSLATGKASSATPSGARVANHNCARSEGMARQTGCRPAIQLNRCKLTIESTLSNAAKDGGYRTLYTASSCVTICS
jgi:hypothetical protein